MEFVRFGAQGKTWKSHSTDKSSKPYLAMDQKNQSVPPSKPLVRGLRDQLVNNLRNDILTGTYQPGDAIRQEDVVARYQVSRTPVREALIQLEQEGLVTTIPNCGARVAPQAPDSIHGLLIPIRRVIEVFALRSCFDSLNDQDFKKWKSILVDMRKACKQKDYLALAEQDIAFHRSIIERAKEPSLLRIWSTIVGQVQTYFLRSYHQYSDLMDMYHEHVAILAMFRSGNCDAAAAFLANRIGEPPDAEKNAENREIAKSASL